MKNNSLIWKDRNSSLGRTPLEPQNEQEIQAQQQLDFGEEGQQFETPNEQGIDEEQQANVGE